MESLQLTLFHGDVLATKCSALFLKHIEGSMSAPEIALNDATGGALQSLNSEHEYEDHSILETQRLPECTVIYVVNFHRQDLPFSYHSVDRYARTIIQVATGEAFMGSDTPITVATAIHGPGAGLDASEAMETLLLGFANELALGNPLRRLREIVLVEKHEDIFQRLVERLKYLAAKDVVRLEGGRYFVNPKSIQDNTKLEQGRINRLALNHLFIAMPYAKEFNNAYYFGIKYPVEQRGRKCERVDQDAFTGDIVERLRRRIATCELIIADITGNNPNVFYEIGYAEGIGKPVILISQEQETPFDLKTRRQIRYDPQDIFSLAVKLGEQLDALLAQGGRAAGPNPSFQPTASGGG
jgi:hypothetical protein